jgi:predicted transcriptional regulator
MSDKKYQKEIYMGRKTDQQQQANEREKRIAGLHAAIARGIADAEAGRVKPLGKVFNRLEARYRRLAIRSDQKNQQPCGARETYSTSS